MMKTVEIKRTLSKVSGKYKDRFTCWFEAGVDIEKEFDDARKHCGVVSPREVICDYTRGDAGAIITSSGGFDVEENNTRIECVRAYLLENGWKEEEEV